MKNIEHIIFDFDGTCTQIPAIYEAFLEEYRQNFSDAIASASKEVTKAEWANALAIVRKNSPREGWSVGYTPSAPAAADPYILSDEAAKLISRRRNISPPSGSGLHSGAYHKIQAPWRPEAREVLCEVHRLGIGIHFVSNSSSSYIRGRLDDLLAGEEKVRKSLSIESDAGKFFIRELSWGTDRSLSKELRAKFNALPVADKASGPKPFSRPIYLRRGSYFEALCRALGNDPGAFAKTLICGDVWELDLAMPFHLGMHVHLIERASPFNTCDYERLKIKGCGTKGSQSTDLLGLVRLLRT